MKKRIIIWMQYVTTWVSALLNNIFLDPECVGVENLYRAAKLQNFYGCAIIFVSNHLSANDPFIITAMIPHALKKSFFPINFLVKKELFSNCFKGSGMSMLGCLPVGNGKGQNVREVIRMIQKGETIFLFPEGRVSPDGNLGEDLGALKMFAKFSGMVVQPIRIEGVKPFRFDWLNMLTFKRMATVHFGSPFFLRKGLEVDAVELIAKIKPVEIAGPQIAFE